MRPFNWKTFVEGLERLAQHIGERLANLAESVLPLTFPDELVTVLGYLVLFTLFLAAVELTRKLAWFLLLISWGVLLFQLFLRVSGVTPQ
jgi:hypothetical protein